MSLRGHLKEYLRGDVHNLLVNLENSGIDSVDDDHIEVIIEVFRELLEEQA